MYRTARRTRAAAVIASLAATAVACSSSGGGVVARSTVGGAFGSALGHVSDSAATRAYIEFGRPRAAEQANGGKNASGPYQRVVGYGLGDLAMASAAARDQLGLDPLAAEYAITVGQPPHQGSLLSGVDAGGAGAELTALGGRRISGPGTTYRLRPDGRIDPTDKLSQALPGVVSSLDVVSTDSSTLRHASTLANLKQTTATGDSLAGDKTVTSVASCLADPLGAIIADRLPSSAPAAASNPTPTAGLKLIGVGVTGSAGTTPTERMCVAADTTAHASAIETSVRQAVASGTSQRTATRWSQLLRAAKVTRNGTVVSLTARAGNGIGGLLLQAYSTADLPGVSG